MKWQTGSGSGRLRPTWDSRVAQIAPPYRTRKCGADAAADVLLLFAQGQPNQVPAKVYEYLHLDRFVLAFTSGATARILDKAAAGTVIRPGEDVAAAIGEYLRTIR